jgi:2-aminoadipate transaminase
VELAINPPDGRVAAPLYVQIAREIRRALERDGLSGGERLPTIRELASHLKVHWDTVGLAYERLVNEGVLDTQVGRGTFVASPPSQTHAFEPKISPLVLRLLDHHQAHTGDPIPDDTIAFHALVPDPAHLPVDSFRRSLNKALSKQGADLLGYGGEGGDAGLRQVVAAHLGEHGIRGGADGVITCQGASQGIALAARAFTEPGDAVLVEEPTYQNALGILVGLGLRPEPVPLRQNAPAGVDLEAVARGLARPEVKAFYTIPTFHNPTGITTDLSHREKLLGIARRWGKPIIEDACAIDLRFRGRDVPPLAALDDSGLVVPLFSFSKSLFPGIRCGAVVARGRTEAAIRALKRFSDLGDALPLRASFDPATTVGTCNGFAGSWSDAATQCCAPSRSTCRQVSPGSPRKGVIRFGSTYPRGSMRERSTLPHFARVC